MNGCTLIHRLCEVEGCGRKHYALGFCAKHWYRFKANGDPLVTKIHEIRQPCKVPGCATLSHSHGYCRKHLRRFLRTGSPLRTTIAERQSYIDENYGYIDLTKDNWAIVDLEWFDQLNQWRWHLNSSGYAIRKKKVDGKTVAIFMHREVARTPAGMFTDHINHDTCDNRSVNLRNCSREQNVHNSVSHVGPTRTSRFKGVCWDKARKKWIARLGKKQLGRFDVEEEAAAAHNAAALAARGEFAWLNPV